MKSKEVARQLIKESGYTYDRLAAALGYKGRTKLHERLSNGRSFAVQGLAELLHLLGYKVVIMPEETRIDPATMFEVDE